MGSVVVAGTAYAGPRCMVPTEGGWIIGAAYAAGVTPAGLALSSTGGAAEGRLTDGWLASTAATGTTVGVATGTGTNTPIGAGAPLRASCCGEVVLRLWLWRY